MTVLTRGFTGVSDTVLTQNRASLLRRAVSTCIDSPRRSFSFASSPKSSAPRRLPCLKIGLGPAGRRADSTRSCNTARQNRGLLEWLEQDAHEVGAACARPHHNTLQIDRFHYRPRGGAIAIIGQRHLEAELVVSKRLGRVDVVEEV